MAKMNQENIETLLRLIEGNLKFQIKEIEHEANYTMNDRWNRLNEQRKTIRRVIEIMTIEPVFDHEAEFYDLDLYNILNDEF